jgi:putative ABC transport system permease protein
VLTASINLPRQKYAKPEQRVAFFDQLLKNLAGLPGVNAAGAVSLLPFGGTNSGTNIHVEGRPEPRPQDAPVVWFRSAHSSYFRAMQIPLRRGRLFTDFDRGSAPAVVVVNEAMARLFWPNEDPIGKRLAMGLRHGANQPWMTVVGLVGDVRHMELSQRPQPEMFFPHSQQPGPGMTVTVRTTGDPLHFAPVLRGAVRSLDREQPTARVASMEQRLSDSLANRRLAMLLLAIFAGVAMVLAAVGIYGVISFSVTRRTHEIGVRMALGAARRDVLWMVVRQGMELALAGLVAGLLAAFYLTRLMRSMLYGVAASDPVVFSGVALLLGMIALLACYVPARRATKVEPVIALRYE